jgi:hypothetical protein
MSANAPLAKFTVDDRMKFELLNVTNAIEYAATGYTGDFVNFLY